MAWSAMDKELRRSLMVLAAVIAVTAWFSNLFYFPDEHYQVLEFMSYKLGITPASELPWEFSVRIRPWFQPLVYYLIAKPLLFLGLKDMFAIAFMLRLATGLFSLSGIGRLCQGRAADNRGHGGTAHLCPLSALVRLSALPLRAHILGNIFVGLPRPGAGGCAGRKIGAAAGAGGAVVRIGV